MPSDRAALKLGYYFDAEKADRVCRFIETLCVHSIGVFAGMPFLLDDWQRALLRTVYGWMRPDGTRRYREVFVEIAKKNGKSTLVSAISLYALFEEQCAQVFLGAVDRTQAAIIFDEAARMVRASPALSKHLKIIDTKKRIVYPAGNGLIEAMSADAPNKDGKNASFTAIDELHRFSSPAMVDVMRYAGRARSQPIFFIITTAGHDRKSVCYEEHERALAAIAGTAEGGDLEFLAMIYAANPDEDDLDDPKTWAKANPSYGKILNPADFKIDHAKAKLLPRLWALFLRLRLNIWTEQVTRWIPLDRWDALADDARTWDLDGLDCYAALDLSSVTDLTALSLFFPASEDGSRPHRIKTFYFVPKDSAERRALVDKVPYPAWIKQGHIVETEGDATDHDAIRLFLSDLADVHNILKVGLDPWNAQQLANQLLQDGHVVEFIRQGYASLSGPSKAFERLILSGRLRHDGNPVTRWCVGNVAIEQDAAGNIKPSKRRSAERIDGAVSMVMSVGLADASTLLPEAGFLLIEPSTDA